MIPAIQKLRLKVRTTPIPARPHRTVLHRAGLRLPAITSPTRPTMNATNCRDSPGGRIRVIFE